MKLLIAGGFCVRGKSVEFVNDEKIREIAEPMSRIIKGCDASIVNFETVITDDQTPIVKSGPALKSPVQSVELVKAFGVHVPAIILAIMVRKAFWHVKYMTALILSIEAYKQILQGGKDLTIDTLKKLVDRLIVVNFRGGKYPIMQTVNFDSSDSGTK